MSRTGDLHLDDWIILFAESLSLAGTWLAIASIAYGWGKPMAYLMAEHLKYKLRL